MKSGVPSAMKPRRGRAVAVANTALCLAVLVAAGIAFKSRLVEEWYFWKLESAEPEERILAAQELGRIRARRAVPHLQRRIDDYERSKELLLGTGWLPTFFDVLERDTAAEALRQIEME